MNLSTLKNRKILSWALYDWANSAFATTVMAGFFPIFFKQYWSAGAEASQSTYQLGVVSSVTGLVLALSGPILGALADISRRKKSFLFLFMLVGALSTAGLYLVEYGQSTMAAILFALAGIGFASSSVFYDALLPNVSSDGNVDVVSGLGYALGYLGGGVLFALNVWMTLQPQMFGLPDASEAIRWSFVSVGVWWFLFSLPLLSYVPEGGTAKQSVRNVLGDTWQAAREIIANKSLGLFLLAYLFYIDGVNTIIKMAVDYGLALGFPAQSLIVALLITQFVGFPAAIVFGFLGQKWGAVRGIYLALAAYVFITIAGYFMQEVSHFYVLAISIGLFQGGIQALSRSYFARMVPAGREASYFGFFNVLGKFSAILGPFFVGLVSLRVGTRASILVILVFLAVGAALFLAQLLVGRRHS